MPLFRCAQCNCVENTALCHYWMRKMEGERLVCSACDPEISAWHDHFPQTSAVGYLVDQSGHLWHPRNIVTMPPTYHIVGIVQAQETHHAP
jgi:hypothetical protein